MKKIRIFIYSIIAFLWLFAGTQTRADFSGFVEQLLNMNIPINTILSNTGINRYELTRLLNAVECKDCVIPNNDYINKYTNLFWQKFNSEPGRDFDDILYRQAMYNKKSYYYCVAYVGDRSYMRWYPKETSPVCAWEFCGTRYTTKAEFLQVIMNMIAKYLYSNYSFNRDNAKKWIEWLRNWSYEYRTFSESDIKTIKSRAKDCGKQVCTLQDANELNIYLKYCMFNLKECGMIPFDKIKEWYWPVAELNILYRQQMISLDDAVKYNINKLIDGKLAIEILANINSLIGCGFDEDYDCDWITNKDDSCANHYNPQQRDLDRDWIWNVCDDDIDWDWAKNPIGIVDENDNINISLWTPNTDNCLFFVNSDQADLDKNWLGDACEQQAAKLSLSIAIQKIEWSVPKTITFGALSKWPSTELKRDFGDGYVWSWSNVVHSYISPWLYTVRLFAKGKWTNDAYAKTTIIVGRDSNEKQWLYLLDTPLLTKTWGEWIFSLSALGNHDSYERNIWWTIIKTDKPSLKKKFTDSGNYPVSVKAINKWEIVAATLFSFGVWDDAYWSTLIPSNILPQKNQEIRFETKLANFLPYDISSIVWDFGDWTTTETNQTTINHIYKSVGKKIIIQMIFLRDWTRLQNMNTLFVWSNNLFSSYAIQLLPSSLELKTFQAFTFKTLPLGDSFADIIFANIIAWDWSSNIFPIKSRLVFPLENKHIYKNPWIYYPQTNISIDQCTQLSAQATLAVGGYDFCLQAKLDWTLLEFVCDMDNDWTPDICDWDIDWDGIPNLLWSINPIQPKNCNYITTLVNNKNQTLINSDLLKIHFKWICTLDNAPYNINNNQSDQNRNWIWDAMELDFDENAIDMFAPIIDTDGDGIPDKDDLCPTIPETRNGTTDYDWCPEIWLEKYCDNNRSPISQACGENENCLSINTVPCLQCPCPFVDIDSDLTNNDVVKAVLWDNQKKYPRRYSIWLNIFY